MTESKGRIEELAAVHLKPTDGDPCRLWDDAVSWRMTTFGEDWAQSVDRLLATHKSRDDLFDSILPPLTAHSLGAATTCEMPAGGSAGAAAGEPSTMPSATVFFYCFDTSTATEWTGNVAELIL
jgi:hypothetical protein